MGIFDRNEIKEDLFKSGGVHPEGTFQGTIVKAELNKTSAGHRVVNVTVKTEKGQLRNGINLDHPNTKAISQKTIGQILDSYENPPAEVGTLEELSDAIVGLPVVVHVKHKGQDDKGYERLGIYFNQLKPEQKVKRSGGAPVSRVDY